MILPLVVATALSLLCYMIARASLGLFLGGLLFAILIAPPLILAEIRTATRLLVLIAICIGVALPWLLAIAPVQWFACAAVLVGTLASVTGCAVLLERCSGRIVAAAWSVVLGLAWIAWPVWLASFLPGRPGLVNTLTAAHPLFAINGVVARTMGIWTEQSVAYHLTNLGQDVSYALPTSIIPAVLLHGLMGAGMWRIAVRIAARSRDDR
jgi:hypothetical protein